MENDKYFIPEMEDIRVGYECELLIYNNWETNIVKDYTALKSVKKAIEKGLLRVSYLTKEQIEAEGWKEITDSKFKKPSHISDHSYYLYFSGYTNVRCILNFVYTSILSEDIPILILYSGPLKSINEFRYICKLLKI